jgi:prepilin-type N-terminal cleavage/methylation domain-containing protein
MKLTLRGFTLIEMSLAVLIAGTVALVLASFYAVLARIPTGIGVKNKANNLAIAVMEEIKCRKWDELAAPAESATLGIDTGETLQDKTTYDDIDDFNNYNGTGMTGLDGFSVNVAVVYVGTDCVHVSATPTTRKEITVTVKKNNVQKMTLNTIVSQKNGL